MLKLVVSRLKNSDLQNSEKPKFLFSKPSILGQKHGILGYNILNYDTFWLGYVKNRGVWEKFISHNEIK